MSILLPVLLACLAPLAAQEEDPPDPWSEVWDAVARLEAAPADSEEFRDLQGELVRRASEATGDVRGELLRRRLARLAGEGPTPWPEVAGERWPFALRESALAIEVLPPGAERVRATLETFDRFGVGEDGRFTTVAWSVAVDEARALRLADGALPIQERLHAAHHAPWSALNLSLTRMWLGDREGADAVLAEAIAAERAAGRSAADLWSQRGICALAAGDERRALDYFGWGLRGGSANAAVVLARRDLDAGRRRAARIAFRALSWDAEPGAWALRGWGLTLLPGSSISTTDTRRSPDSNGR